LGMYVEMDEIGDVGSRHETIYLLG
jgi:hypothetical protein